MCIAEKITITSFGIEARRCTMGIAKKFTISITSYGIEARRCIMSIAEKMTISIKIAWFQF